MGEKVRAHVIIRGRVQGVFFRVNTARAAERFGVFGWVRNKKDRTVEAVFEGNKENVDAVLDWCNTGDAPANVTTVELTWGVYGGEYNTFDITH